MPLEIPAPRESGHTSTTDVPLYWAAYGPEGTPRMLVLHGGPGAHHDYLLPQMLQLAEKREVVFYDQRGGGRSRTEDRDPITWRKQVDDLSAVIRELSLEPLTLCGYSWGGLLALLYSIEAFAPESHMPQPRRIVLIDPAPVSRAHRLAFEAEFARRQASPEVAKLREELASSGIRESDPEAHRQRAFELSVAGYFADPTRARDLTPFRVIGRVQQSIWQSLGDYDLTDQVGRVTAPVLIVHGTDDPIPIASSEALATQLPDAEFVELPDVGHVPYVEDPEGLFGAIDRFLTGLDEDAID